MRTASRLDDLSGYAFAELDRLRDERRAAGVDVIDFGVGDPTEPVPESVVQAAQSGLWEHRRAGYPSYVGSRGFRSAASAWMERRFGVTLDPLRQVCATVGSKEAVFHLPLAFVDPDDVVLVPSPGYPPYVRGTTAAGGRCHTYAVGRDGPLLPDLERLPREVSERLRVVWITQPHVPTGRIADLTGLRRLADQARERDVLLCSDEAYSELWFDQPPPSALQAGCEQVLVFQSLSKQAAMTSYRVGFVAGDAEAVAAFGRVKTNVDSGTPLFVQDAAVAALGDGEPAASARAAYRTRAEMLIPALRRLGCGVALPQAGFYLWCSTPGDVPGHEFARRLLEQEPAMAVMPGEWLADPVAGAARQPGDGFFRVALVPSLERCREAAARLGRWAAKPAASVRSSSEGAAEVGS